MNRHIDTLQLLFLELLRISVGNTSDADFHISREMWEGLYNLAKQHAVLGITFDAADSLPTGQRPPLGIYTRWALAAEKISEVNGRLNADVRAVYDQFRQWGFNSCVLKGQGVASLYPIPMHRQCGDIDLWVDSSRDGIVSFLRAQGLTVKDIVYHHCSSSFKVKTELEVHFTPTWMNGFFKNRRLQAFFKENAPAQFANYEESLGFAIPDRVFAAIYGMIHIFRHVFFEGIGFRQIIDEYFIISKLSSEERAIVFEKLCSFIPKRFIASVMYVFGEVLGMPDSEMFCSPDRKYGQKLLREIFESGNFGQSKKNNRVTGKDGLITKAVKRLTMISSQAFSYPGEFFAAPFFKLWQFFWRKSKGYI